MGVMNTDGSPLSRDATVVGIVGDTDADTSNQNLVPSPDNDVTDARVAYLTYPNFYRIKKWNNSNWYAIAIGVLSEKLK
jgi:membrane-bound lytic murein transglycosylase B